jgi:hypothetical protein
MLHFGNGRVRNGCSRIGTSTILSDTSQQKLRRVDLLACNQRNLSAVLFCSDKLNEKRKT